MREALITGDFFVTPPRVIFDLEAALRGVELTEAGTIMEDFFSRTPAEFLNLGPADIRDVVLAATRQLSFVAAGHRLRGHRIAATRATGPPWCYCMTPWAVPGSGATSRSGLGQQPVAPSWSTIAGGRAISAPLEPPHSRHYLLEEALESLPEVLQAMHIRRPILVGHSDGAAIALTFAGAFPDLVSGVVAIAPHLFREQRTIAGIADQIADFEHGDLKVRLARYHGSKTDQLFRRLVDAWSGEEPRDWGIEQYVGQVRCPVLAIQGTEDEFFTRVQIDALKALVSVPIETRFLPGCGHAPQQQTAKAVVAAAAHFIDRVTTDAGVEVAPAFG